MAESNTTKFDNVYKLLSELDFFKNRNIPDGFKCRKCRNILIDTCQVRCGCRYCRNCIYGMLANGCQICPGDTEFCKDEQLSNYQTDYSKNRKILKLKVKCPEQLCQYECELVNMEEHVRLCSNRSVACPFYDIGCNEDKLLADMVNNHLQSEGYHHNMILIKLIGDLRKTVNVLKEDNETNKLEIQTNKEQIELLKENIRVKDEIIVVINGDCNRNKEQMEILNENSRIKDEIIAVMNQKILRNKAQIDSLADNSGMKDQMIAEMQQQIRSINEERQQITAQINHLKIQSDNKIADLREEMTKECQDNLGRKVRRINDEMNKRQLQLTSGSNIIDKEQGRSVDAPFSWRVDQMSDKRQNGTRIWSEIFYPKASPYKMKLYIVNDAASDQLYIQLIIYPSEDDARLEWPFHRNVTIQISNQAHPNAPKTITQYCKIPKPNNGSYKCSEPFQFSYDGLSTAGLMQDDYFICQCHVE